jgi:acyl-CoA thioesterase-1
VRPVGPGPRTALSLVSGGAVFLAGFWIVRVSQLRGNVDAFRRYWAVPRGEPGGILYVALGDSTAQGIGASRPERGYVGLIAERLRAASGRPVQIVNLSRVGARVADVLADQIPGLDGLDPDLVTLAVGGNDMRTYHSDGFHADVDALVAALPANTVVGDVPWFMHGGTGEKSGEAAKYVAAVAHARNLPVARLHQAMRERGWRSMISDFAADWFHLNNRGYRVWADAFWTAITEGGRVRAGGS